MTRKALKDFNIKEINDFQEIINKALAKELDNRYKKIDELVNDLQLIGEGIFN